MAIKAIPVSDSGGKGKPGKEVRAVLQKVIDVAAPPVTRYSLNPAPQAASRQSGPSAAQQAASAAAAAQAKYNAAGKAQSQKENNATQGIINSLMAAANQFAGGRDIQIGNAERALSASLLGIGANYKGAVDDYMKTGLSNDQDEASKTAANVTNRARERVALLEQAASMGAGETDQMRAQLQAFQNFDANALEIARGFFDTSRSIDSQIQGANNQAMTSRRSAWQQAEEARGNAWNEYYKNYSDTWTNIQRTAAQNSNIDSDSSTAFNAQFNGLDATTEASKYAGSVYQTQDKDEGYFKNFDGRVENREVRSTATNRAGAVQIAAPKAAEGATLRRRT